MNSHKPDTPRISAGLLFVIKDISQEYKIHKSLPPSIETILNKIKSELFRLMDDVIAKNISCEEVDMKHMLSGISSAVFEVFCIVSEKDSEEAKKQYESGYESLLNLMKQFIEEGRLSVKDFTDKYLSFPDNQISRFEFIYLLKKTLRLRITTSELVGITYFLEANDLVDINLDEILEDLKQVFIGNPYIIRKERNSLEPKQNVGVDEVYDKFKEFIANIEKNFEEAEDDITMMVKNVKSQLIDPALARNDMVSLQKFFSNLHNAFYNPDHKIYLINILKNILLLEVNYLKNNDQSFSNSKENDYSIQNLNNIPLIPNLNNIALIQNLYANENIISLCFSQLKPGIPSENINLTLDLLCNLVMFNNTTAKQSILDFLKKDSFKIFSFIRGYLRDLQDIVLDSDFVKPAKKGRTLMYSTTIFDNSKKNIKKIEKGIKILLFLQLCCNNCFLPFQEFLKNQDPNNLFSNIDLVSEICLLLTRLQGLNDLKKNTTATNINAKLALQCIKTLIDCCQGPCEINQLVLGQSRRLYEFMNWLFNCDLPNFSKESV